MHSKTNSPKHAYRNKTTNMHSPKIIGILCATCLWQKGEVGASTVERSSFLSASLIHQTSHNKHAFIQSFKKYDMHGMHTFQGIWYAWYANYWGTHE